MSLLCERDSKLLLIVPDEYLGVVNDEENAGFL